MKKFIVALAIIGISAWGATELNAAFSFQALAPDAGKCARATEECDENPGHYEVWCKDGGAGYKCSTLFKKCPYLWDDSDCDVSTLR